MSVTGWFVMALQSARMAGIEVPSPVFEKIEQFLDSVQRGDEQGYDVGSRYAYRPTDGATLHAHRRRPVVPPVSGLAARRSAAQRGRRVPRRQPARVEQAERVLLVLRHASAAPHGRQAVARLERRNAQAPARAPG